MSASLHQTVLASNSIRIVIMQGAAEKSSP